MKLTAMVGLVFCGALSCAPLVVAQQVQEPTMHKAGQLATIKDRYGFFSNQAYKVEPQLDAVLFLTNEQKKALKKISEEVLLPIVLRRENEKREEARSGKQPTAAEQKFKSVKFAMEAIQAANEIRRRAWSILTPEQKATVSKVNPAIRKVFDEITASYTVKIQAASAVERVKLEQERDEAVRAEALLQLEKLLTPEQKQALHPN